jgi:hypothetical protein
MNVRALLRHFGRVQLHGAAVEVDGRAIVFLGDKGAGKSTLSLALGRAGVTVLTDDQLVVRRGTPMSVSGVDGGLRLTEQTERHFFERPLAASPQEYGGFVKKEVALADHVRALPRVDFEPVALFFPTVGDRVEVAPVSRMEAIRRVLAPVVPLHRFAGADDQRDFVRMVSELVQSVEVHDLQLSRDLTDLSGVVEMVRSVGR